MVCVHAIQPHTRPDMRLIRINGSETKPDFTSIQKRMWRPLVKCENRIRLLLRTALAKCKSEKYICDKHLFLPVCEIPEPFHHIAPQFKRLVLLKMTCLCVIESRLLGSYNCSKKLKGVEKFAEEEKSVFNFTLLKFKAQLYWLVL